MGHWTRNDGYQIVGSVLRFLGPLQRTDDGRIIGNSDMRLDCSGATLRTAVSHSCIALVATNLNVSVLKILPSSVWARPDIHLTVQRMTDAEHTSAMVKLDWRAVEQPCVQL